MFVSIREPWLPSRDIVSTLSDCGLRHFETSFQKRQSVACLRMLAMLAHICAMPSRFVPKLRGMTYNALGLCRAMRVVDIHVKLHSKSMLQSCAPCRLIHFLYVWSAVTGLHNALQVALPFLTIADWISKTSNRLSKASKIMQTFRLVRMVFKFTLI